MLDTYLLNDKYPKRTKVQKKILTQQPILEIKIYEDEEKKKNYLGFMITLLINIYAGMISWSCNKNLHFIPRSIFSLFAFSFGIIYIMLHLIFRETIDQCK